MIKDENDEDTEITLETYKHYFGKYYGGIKFVIITQVSMIFYCVSSIGCDYIIGQWTNLPDQKSNMWIYAGLSFAFGIFTAGSIAMRVSSILYFSLGCDRKLHEDMITRVINAPINLYYDVTPIGRVLNKFSSDLGDLSTQLCFTYGSMLAMFYNLV